MQNMNIAMPKSTTRGVTIETARIFDFWIGVVADANKVGENVMMLLVGVGARFGELFVFIDAADDPCVDLSVAGREKVAELVSGDDTRETVIILVEVESMLNVKEGESPLVVVCSPGVIMTTSVYVYLLVSSTHMREDRKDEPETR
jgi:hypothetical protein